MRRWFADNWFFCIVGFYALMFVVTFGHAVRTERQWRTTHCARIAEADKDACAQEAASVVLTASALWPLYWSVQLWK